MLSKQATWTQFLFSTRGRFRRAQYWGATFLVYGIMFAYVVPAIVADSAHSKIADTDPGLVAAYAFVGLALFFVAVWVHACTIVKRFHDRDKAWYWVFMVFAPYIGSFWIFVECGCLSGTPRRNRYGADPLNPLDIADVFEGPAPVPTPSRVVAEPQMPPSCGVTSQDRLG